MSDVILATDRADGVRLLTVSNPPVNAISAAVRQGLVDAMAAANQDDGVKAIVLTGAGRTFIAGADIREFGTTPPPGNPNLVDVIHAIEDSAKPVVAALNGAALGGGLEIAMGCHWRLATAKAPCGLPEVHLGLIPGATGTQRLPRLIGVEAALDMIISGRPVPGSKAAALGIVDDVVDSADDLIDAAAAMALARPVRKLREDDSRLEAPAAGFFDQYKAGMARRQRGFLAPFAAVDLVQLATSTPYDSAIMTEREVFYRLRDGDQSPAMRHVFFADREVAKVPGLSKETPVQDILSAGIIGAGTMGGGIAMNFVNAGIPVVLIDRDQAAVTRGVDTIRANYAATVKKGRLSQQAMDERMALIAPSTDYGDLADVDIVIEAAFENMAVKKEIFAALDKICQADAVLATNTSTLDIDAIATAVSRPEKVVGTHFFSPANVMRLMENVRAAKTDDVTAASVMALAKKIGKVGVMVGVCDGFVGNRMLYAYTRQASFLLEEGALPQQVDQVLYDFGLPMGPFAMGDLAGIDVGYLVRQERIKRLGPSGKRESELGDQIYHLDRLGQKNGRGWYRYEAGSRAPVPDPVVEALIVAESEKLGLRRRAIADKEILERCLFPLVNEGAKILSEGIAARSLDIDLVWIYGYGFPRYRGGPMFWADQLGLDYVLSRLEYFRDHYDSDWLAPAPLLRDLAAAGKGFGDLQA